jgi:hypothetical protein
MMVTTPPGVMVLKACYADTGQVGLVLIDPVGGALANPAAVRIGIV